MAAPVDLLTVLPARVWFLTADGTAVWHEGPYTFLFSEAALADAFATAMKKDGLFAVGLDAPTVVAPDMQNAFARAGVRRVFMDPEVDSATGDVFGTIVHLPAPVSH